MSLRKDERLMKNEMLVGKDKMSMWKDKIEDKEARVRDDTRRSKRID